MRFLITLISSTLATLLLLSLLLQDSEAYVVDRVLAQVGDKIVTQYDVEAYAPAKVRSINALPEDERENIWNEYYESTMEDIIHAYVVELAALRLDITTADNEVEEAILTLQEQNSEFRTELRAIIAREGIVTPEVKQYVKTIVLQQKLLPMLRYRSVITDEDILKYMREDMNIEPDDIEYRVKLLFLPDGAAYEALREQLPEGFEDVPAETGATDIDMGYIQSTMLLPEMGAMVRGMQAGQVSAPYVDDEGRYVIIKVTDTRKSSGISETDREYLMNTLRNRQMETIFENWLERNKKTIIIYRYD
jgi:peptidyl-prolyl cis-trans isomerase SurA